MKRVNLSCHPVFLQLLFFFCLFFLVKARKSHVAPEMQIGDLYFMEKLFATLPFVNHSQHAHIQQGYCLICAAIQHQLSGMLINQPHSLHIISWVSPGVSDKPPHRGAQVTSLQFTQTTSTNSARWGGAATLISRSWINKLRTLPLRESQATEQKIIIIILFFWSILFR